MNPSTKDQIEGKLHEHNPGLAAEGQDEKLAGIVQKKVGQIEKVFEK